MIEYSRDAPFSPNAVVTIRTLGQEKRQFLISDMMRMSVAQHGFKGRLARQTYQVGHVRPAGWGQYGCLLWQQPFRGCA